MRRLKNDRAVLAVPVLFLAFASISSFPLAASSKVDISGRIVLANPSKHTASFRVAKVKKDIAPGKASVLSPKAYPMTLEFWDGKHGSAAWVPLQIESAGVFAFRYQNGQWTLTRRQASAKSKPSASKPSTPQNASRTPGTGRPSYQRPTYRRSTGTASRVVRGSGRIYWGGRVPLLRRVTSDLLWLYRFVRDEEDRDLIRDIIIGREIDREIERELWDRLDDLAVNLPAEERREWDRVMRDLQDLSDGELRDLENATEEEWDQVRGELGDGIDDDIWGDVETDYSEIDIDTLPADEIDGLDTVGIDSLDSDIDLGDLEGPGLSDLTTTLDSVDFGELGGGIEDIDIGDLGTGFDLEPGVGIGSDLGNQGFANPLGDLNPDLGGGFDYDQGGFDDFGSQLGGGDFSSGDFAQPQFGGGFGGGDFGGNFGGGDFGGGDFGGGNFGGGDFGGGFDDFGGGGFDDFGGGDFGGFDDF